MYFQFYSLMIQNVSPFERQGMRFPTILILRHFVISVKVRLPMKFAEQEDARLMCAGGLNIT